MVDLHHPWLVHLVLAALLIRLLTGSAPGVPIGTGALPRLAPWRRGGMTGHLRSVAILSVALAAAGPHRSVVLPGDGSDGVAIMVALDVSESMGEASSWGPRKIDVAVDGVRRFLQDRPQDMVGLVSFHRTAVLSVPPLLDRRAFDSALERARTETLGDGTALGVAVGFAADRLRAVDARSRVIILVTDGESNAGSLDPLTAVRAAAALGHRLFIVEVGAGAQGSDLLDRLAGVGGGRHFAVGAAAAVQAAYAEIDAMEPTRFAGVERTVEVPAPGLFLWLALACLAFELTLRALRLERLA